MENKNKTAMWVLAGLLFSAAIGLAFAALTTTLTINGQGSVKSPSWDVHFGNLNSTTTPTASIMTMPSLTSTAIGTYDVELRNLGDKVTFTFNIINDGTVNAKITTFTKPTPVCVDGGTTNAVPAGTDAALVSGALVYTLKYTSTGTDIAVGDILTAGESKNVTLTIEYPDTGTLPQDKVHITFPETIILYTQEA